MLTLLITIIVAFFGSAILVGLYQGIKEGFCMTDEEAKKIIEEEQQRKEQQRKEEERLAQVKLDRYLNRLKNKLNESEYHIEEDDDDDEDDDEDNIDDILYGDLDKAIDDYNQYGIGQDPDEEYTFGGYVNPELHKRKEERKFNDWLKQQK